MIACIETIPVKPSDLYQQVAIESIGVKGRLQGQRAELSATRVSQPHSEWLGGRGGQGAMSGDRSPTSPTYSEDEDTGDTAMSLDAPVESDSLPNTTSNLSQLQQIAQLQQLPFSEPPHSQGLHTGEGGIEAFH